MNNAEEAAAAQPAVGEAPKAGGVADLERRLAMLGDDTANDPPPPMEVAEQSFAAPPAVAVAPAATGKNALLVSLVFCVSIVAYGSLVVFLWIV